MKQRTDRQKKNPHIISGEVKQVDFPVLIFIKIKKQNSKFAVGEDEFFPTFQINTKIEVCIPNPQIWVQAILGEYGDIFYGYFLFAQYRYF